MRRRLVLVLVLVLTVHTRAEDGPERPSYVDAKTWEKVKADWTARWQPLVEAARLANANRALVHLESRRRAGDGAMPGGPELNALLLDAELTALHAVGFANQTDPRLSGHVVRIGADGEPGSIRAALHQLLP